MGGGIYDFMDGVLPILFFLSFAAMLLFAVNLMRRLRSRIKVLQGNHYALPYPVKSGLFFAAVMIAMMAMSLTVCAEARAEIKAYLDHVDMHTLKVEVNGKAALDPARVLDALRMKQPIPAHHSHPMHRILVVVTSASGSLSLILARDSEDPLEYWISYPRYHSTLHMGDVYRVHTDVFDKD